MVKEVAKILTLEDWEITIDSRLNYLNDKVLSPKKLQMANEILARGGLPNEPDFGKEPIEDKPTTMNPLGTLIKQTRLQRNLSEEALAALLGVENTVIFRLENNDNSVSMETILQVFHVLDAELSFMVKLKP